MNYFRKNVFFSAFVSLCICWCFFAAQTVAIIIDGVSLNTKVLQTLSAIALSSGFYGILWIVLFFVFLLLVVFVSGRQSASMLVNNYINNHVKNHAKRIKKFLFCSEPTIKQNFIKNFVTYLLLIIFAFGLAIFIGSSIFAKIQTPLYGSILFILAILVSIVLSVVLLPIWKRTGYLIGSIFANPPSAYIIISAIAALVATVFIFVFFKTWSSIGYAIAWRLPLLIMSACVLNCACFIFIYFFKFRTAIFKRIFVFLGIFLFVSGAIWGAFLPLSFAKSSRMVTDLGDPTHYAYLLVAAILDFDNDGYLSFLAQNDCKPFNPNICPSSIDKPNDGVDQNCDGTDQSFKIVIKQGRHDYNATPAPASMPVILVTLDGVTASNLDLYGYKRQTMPLLTQRAQSAAVFKYAFSEGPSTRLTFPSMMTGKYCSQIKRRISKNANTPWKDSNITLAEILSQNGYKTGAIAPDSFFSNRFKWIYKGFETVDSSPAQQGFRNTTGQKVTSAAEKQLKILSQNDNFFMWVHYTDVHDTNGKYVLPLNEKPFLGGHKQDYYDRAMQIMDVHVNNFLNSVARQLNGRDYIVVLTADHGESFDAKHFKKGHHGWDLSTSVTHVPLVIWSPYLVHKSVDRLASTIDIVPTILNMVKIKQGKSSEASYPGDSLLPSIQNNTDEQRPIMQQLFLPEYAASGKSSLRRASVRKGKYVLHHRAGEYELYNFWQDPFEENNLAAKKHKILKFMAALRAKMIKKYHNPSLK